MSGELEGAAALLAAASGKSLVICRSSLLYAAALLGEQLGCDPRTISDLKRDAVRVLAAGELPDPPTLTAERITEILEEGERCASDAKQQTAAMEITCAARK